MYYTILYYNKLPLQITLSEHFVPNKNGHRFISLGVDRAFGAQKVLEGF